MKKIVLIMLALMSNGWLLANHWTPNSAPYEDNMTLTGVIQINGEEQHSTSLELGVFCGEECRGSGMPTYFGPTQRHIVQMIIYGENGDQLTFKLFDHDQNMELDLVSPDAITFIANGYGSLMNPYVLNFTDSTPESYTVTATANPTDGGMVSGGGTYNSGATATLTATANAGYAFTNWTENGTAVSTSATYSFTVTGNRTLVANFTESGSNHWVPNSTPYEDNMTLTGVIQINGEEQHSTSLELGVFCGEECRGSGMPTYFGPTQRHIVQVIIYGENGDQLTFKLFDHDQNVELDLVSPDAITFIANGYGSLMNPYVLNFTSSTLESYTVTVTANPEAGGTVSGGGTYNSGATATLTATANAGYAFTNWTENGTSVSTSATYSFTVTGNRTLVANFTESGSNHWVPNSTSYEDNMTLTGVIQINGEEQHSTSLELGVFCGEECRGSGMPTYFGPTQRHIIQVIIYGENGDQLTFKLFDHDQNVELDLVSPATITFNANGYGYLMNPYVLNFTSSTLESYSITTSANPAAGGTVTGAGTYYHGAMATLIATANEGYTFVNWTKDGQQVSTSLTYSFTVTEVGTYVANFSLNSYDITTMANPSDGGAVIGAGTYDHGATATLTATASPGYTFVNWTMDGQQISTNSTYSFTVTEAGTYVANFSLNSYDITAVANPAEGGTVTGAGTYDHGATVTLTATANEGYTFVNWTEDGQQVSTSSTYSFTVTEVGTYVANFSLNSYEITVTANPTSGGTVGGSGTYDHGATATLTATANEGYTFVNWTRDDQQVSTSATYNFMVTEGGAYVANFNEYFQVFVDYYPDTSNPYSEYVKVHWSEGFLVEDLYRANCDGSEKTLIAANVTGNEYIDYVWSGLSSGNYKYGVSVANTNGRESETIWVEPTVTNSRPSTHEAAENLDMDVYWTESSSHVSNILSGNREMWDLMATFNAAEGAQYGVAYDGTYFYTCNWGYGSATYNFYKYDLNGNVIEGFNIEGCGTIRDLTYDGQYFYGGAASSVLYCVDLANKQLISSTTTSCSAIRYCAYDPVRDGFWVGNWSTDIMLISRTGSILVTGPVGMSFSGAAYYLDENNVEHVYMFAQPSGNGSAVVYDYNIVSNSYNSTPIFDVASNLPGFSGSSGGCFIGEYGGKIVFFGDVQQSPNLIGIYELGNSQNITWSDCIEKLNVYYDITVTANPTAGGTVSGGGTYQEGQTCILTATANSGYSFINWTKDGEIVGTSATYSFTVTETASFEAVFELANITQTSDFVVGWNWWSSYVECGPNSLTELQDGLGTSGVIIKTQNDGYNSYVEGFGWYGSVTAINNESSYQIKTSAPCVVEMTGASVDPAAHPITLSTGWTWIGYPVSSSMSLEEALSGLSPASSDMLKSQNNGFASYMEGLGWYGSLNTLNPSMGLMYKSNSSDAVTFIYPNGAAKSELKPNQIADNNHWQPNLNAYPDNMSVMAVVELDAIELKSDHYELAAFANGECRGSARLMYVEPLNRHMAFLTVAGDEVAELNFALYNDETGAVETQCLASLHYETNAIIGSFEAPYVVRFGSTTGVDEWVSNLQVYPNPVECGQVVSFGLSMEETGEVQVAIINTIGVVVDRQCFASLQVSSAIKAPNVPGVYTLRITMEGKDICYKRLIVR